MTTTLNTELLLKFTDKPLTYGLVLKFWTLVYWNNTNLVQLTMGNISFVSENQYCPTTFICTFIRLYPVEYRNGRVSERAYLFLLIWRASMIRAAVLGALLPWMNVSWSPSTTCTSTFPEISWNRMKMSLHHKRQWPRSVKSVNGPLRSRSPLQHRLLWRGLAGLGSNKRPPVASAVECTCNTEEWLELWRIQVIKQLD